MSHEHEDIAKIFLSYERRDQTTVERLYHMLKGAGYQPWMDKYDILPGERWRDAIKKAVSQSDFFLACISGNSLDKRGLIQTEIKYALEMWDIDGVTTNPRHVRDSGKPFRSIARYKLR